ncbi:MAG TPA: hypothetical protein VEB61_15705, partial [Candidatus Binatia bacterium]|nr:hypothetical protein [Candidatus Binatia bacterium]
EEVLLRFFSSKEDVDRMRAAGPARSYTRRDNPLLNLFENLSKENHRNRVFIQNRNFTLRMEKRRQA